MLTQNIDARPTKAEQQAAMESYNALEAMLAQLEAEVSEIEIEETEERIKVPKRALALLAQVLKATGEGKIVSVVPQAAEMTTQAAADMLGCSRPHLVKLLESGEIDFVKVGKHRRVRFEDVIAYKQKMKDRQRQLIVEIMHADEDDGLYDS